jgi:uncharacterized metal-binding protein
MSPPDQKPKVIIVPCSGIGKAQGSVSREAAYDLVEEVRPATTELVGLPLLVLGDEQARAKVAGAPAITIDGCKLMCAAKMVRQAGGTVAAEATVMDAYRRHKDLKAQGIAQLNEAGCQLAWVLAEELAATVDTLTEATAPKEVPHA